LPLLKFQPPYIGETSKESSGVGGLCVFPFVYTTVINIWF